MLSKETTDQIRKEAEDACSKYCKENNKSPAQYGSMVDGYELAATAWAVWKEKAEWYEKALEDISEFPKIPVMGGMSHDFAQQKLKEIATKALEQFH